MKRTIILFLLMACVNILHAQSQLQFNDVNHQTNKTLRYKLYPTFNMWTYLKLDTRTGRVSMLQFSTLGKDSEGEYYIGMPLETYSGENENINGRYELYPTTNMWTFLMIDQINGNTYHVQWSNQKLEYNQLYRIN